MNRREAIAALTAAGTAAGIGTEVQAKAVTSDDDIVLFVIELDRHVSQEAIRNIEKAYMRWTEGTPFHNVKVAVLEHGMSLKAVSRKGLIDITGGSD